MEREILKSILKASSEGIIITDNKLQIIDYNEIALGILGLEKDHILNKKLYNKFENMEFLDKCLEEGQSFRNADCIFNISKEKIKSVANISPVEREGKVWGIVIAFKDSKKLVKDVNGIMGYKAVHTFEDIITKNQSMKKIIEYSKKAAKADCNILIEGSSGTGKKVFAQAIHNLSKRAKGPFVAVNCASIPRELMESELFGNGENGLPGMFELAEGGTIFLDCIEELPLEVQLKLLKVLDNKKIVNPNSAKEKNINVRIISASNLNLMDEVDKKSFRHDLYYRLNVVAINLMDLKDRPEDIELFLKYFLNKLNIKNPETIKVIENDAIVEFKNFKWEKNISELRSVLEKAYYCSNDNKITTKSVINILKNKSSLSYSKDINKKDSCIKETSIMTLKKAEEENIKKALEYCKGNIETSAKLLGISKATMYRKIAKYSIKID